MTDEQIKKAEEMALRIIQVSQNSLLLNLRFMDSAIFRLKPKLENTTLATDGQYIYFGFKYILNRYKECQDDVTRDVLHMILHCIFKHSFVRLPIDIDVWDLASDIAVENMITSLDINCTKTDKEQEQKHIIDELKRELNILNAEKIYRFYKNKNLSKEQIYIIRKLFISDDHSIWYNYEKTSGGTSSNKVENIEELNNQSSGGLSNNSSKFLRGDSNLEEEWSSISRQIQMDMETFSKNRGILAGDMVQQLRELNREKYDYGAFLKKFAVMGEVMKINDDEFDYIFYTYGLKLFKNMPLIEPLEYKEEKRIREFVIAIDTSGSTSGNVVQKFLEKTYNILKSTESFFSKINLHIIQCDATIQEHVKVTNNKEFDDYIDNMTIKGLGGTDFRPVFSMVDQLIEKKKFENLKGLIYFTDGLGTFPLKKPSYETALVFLRNDYFNPVVPPWAIKLILDDDEI